MPDALQSEKCFACTPPSVCDSLLLNLLSAADFLRQIKFRPRRTRDSTFPFVQFTQLNCRFAHCSQPQPKRHAVRQVMWHIGGATENRLLRQDPRRHLGASGKMDEMQLQSTLLQQRVF